MIIHFLRCATICKVGESWTTPRGATIFQELGIIPFPESGGFCQFSDTRAPYLARQCCTVHRQRSITLVRRRSTVIRPRSTSDWRSHCHESTRRIHPLWTLIGNYQAKPSWRGSLKNLPPPHFSLENLTANFAVCLSAQKNITIQSFNWTFERIRNSKYGSLLKLIY